MRLSNYQLWKKVKDDYDEHDWVGRARHDAWQDLMIWLLRRRRRGTTEVVATDSIAVGCRLTLTADQAIASTTDEQVLFDDASFDNEGFADLANSRILIPSDQDGLYIFSCQLEVDSSVDTNISTTVGIVLNDTYWLSKIAQPKDGGGGTGNNMSLSAIYPVVAGDYITAVVYTDASSAAEVLATSTSAQLSCVRVGPYNGDPPDEP